MRKSRDPETTPQGNAAKYLSYREAWARIGAARGYGFYLEAVTIEESIISDRLTRYLIYRSAIRIEEGKDRQPSFYNLIQLWKQQPEAINEPGIPALQDAVDRWRQLYGRYHCMDLADRLFEAAPGDLSIAQGGEELNEGE